jgi:hypothetical protein
MRRPNGHIAPYTLLCVLSLALFAPSFDNGFRDDDYNFLYKTVHAEGLAQLVSDSAGLTFFRPGAWLLFAAEYKAFGMHSGPYVVVNWAIHLLNSFLLLLVLRRAGYGASVAAWAAGLFVLGFGHYGKQVMWACTSGPLTSVALTLTTVLLALKTTDPDAGPVARRMAPLCAVPALLATSFHESAVVVPVIALALCLKAFGPWREMRKAPILWTAASLLWFGILAIVSPMHDAYTRVASDPVTALRFIRYVGIMVLPVQNSPLLDRVWPWLSVNAHVVQLIVGIAVLAATVLYIRARGLGVGALLAWLLVALAPFSLVGISANWVERRYVYFPAMAFDTLLVLLLMEWGRSLRWTALALAITVTIPSA